MSDTSLAQRHMRNHVVVTLSEIAWLVVGVRGCLLELLRWSRPAQILCELPATVRSWLGKMRPLGKRGTGVRRGVWEGCRVQVKIAISRGLGIPLGTQVHDQIVAAISKGDLRPGDRLPTIRQLADFLELNRNTIAQVYRALEQEGYVLTRGGGGTTIADTLATQVAVRTQDLHQLVREALHAAERKGYSAREFSEVALYEAAQWQALRHVALLVLDEYQGELDYLCRSVRHLMPGAIVYGMLLGELSDGQRQPGTKGLPEVDSALVPFYCLDRAREMLAASNIPVLVAGIGPSVAALRQIAAKVDGHRVAIVCTEPAGPHYMERALRHAGIHPGQVQHAYVDQADFGQIIDACEIIIASEGSVESVDRLETGRPILAFSSLLGEDTLAAIHRHIEMLRSDVA